MENNFYILKNVLCFELFVNTFNLREHKTVDKNKAVNKRDRKRRSVHFLLPILKLLNKKIIRFLLLFRHKWL